MLHPTPSGPDPLRPNQMTQALAPRSAAAQRRAMQAAMASALRAMRSTGGRRGAAADDSGATPAADA